MTTNDKNQLLNSLFPELVAAIKTAATALNNALNATSTKAAPAKRGRKPAAATGKRGPGRPAKSATPVAATTPAKRGPGRPKKNAAPAPVIVVEKRRPGRPKKVETVAATTPAKRGPGRPKKVDATNGISPQPQA